MTAEAEMLLEQAYTQFQFSTRAYHKILKVARTVADMEGTEKIQSEHICEALTYRAYDKNTGHKMKETEVLYNGRKTKNDHQFCGKKQ